MKKILMLLQAPFPPDIRLEKEIKTLSSHDYKVILLCNQYDREKHEYFHGCKILRVKAITKNPKLNKIINFPLFFNPRLIYYTVKTYITAKPDYVHAHDLPMVPLALILKLLFKKPVIFDMHENYPEALKSFEKKGLIDFLFKNYKFAKYLEKFCVKYSDIIISVVEENKERLKKLGIHEKKLFIVSNTVDLNTFTFEHTIPLDLKEYKNNFVIVYSGTVSPERGLFTALKAAQMITKKIPNFIMLIIGDGKSVAQLNNFINEENLTKVVKMIPWVGHNKILNYIKLADICMIPQPANDFINTTIPHKLFEYMSIGKTLLVSDAVPLKRIVEETNCGLTFKSDNPIDFADKIVEIYMDYSNIGQNGRKWVENKYNWKFDARNLLKIYNSL